MEKINKDGQASERNPMTKVYKIVDGLKEYFEQFYKRKAKYESNLKLQYYFAFFIRREYERSIKI